MTATAGEASEEARVRVDADLRVSACLSELAEDPEASPGCATVTLTVHEGE